MYEVLKAKLAHYGNDRIKKYNFLREYLQLLVLRILDEKGYFTKIAFVGGTALRILYDLNRFSEDLDFCLINNDSFSFKDMISVLKNEFGKQNFQIEVTSKDHKTVASAFVKFNQLLFDLNLSPNNSQKLSIKIEIDCKPPIGFQTELTMINKEFLIGINHYDLPSLFAGKLHAILCRTYTKGRDFYDLIWFLGRKIEPNYNLLSHAIEQTEKKVITLNREKLMELLLERVQTTDFKKVQRDIEPFLADANEMRYFEKEYFLQLITT